METKQITFELKATPKSINGTYYYFYKIINLQNNKFYYGVHKTKDLEDGYPGSGYALRDAITKTGISNYRKEILKFFDNAQDMFKYEESIVTIELVNNPQCYNLKLGGMGGWESSINQVTVKDNKGNCFRVSKNDPRYLSGELLHNCVGRINVEDIATGVYLNVSVEEYWAHKDIYRWRFTGKVTVQDKTGKIIQISKEEFDKGIYKGTTTGLGVFKDKAGNVIQCSTKDSRVLSGELVGYTKGLTCYKYKHDFTKTVHTTKDDPRVISGELVGINWGLVHCRDKNGNKITVSKDDPRLKSGELITSTRWGNNQRKLKNYEKDNSNR